MVLMKVFLFLSRKIFLPIIEWWWLTEVCRESLNKMIINDG